MNKLESQSVKQEMSLSLSYSINKEAHQSETL